MSLPLPNDSPATVPPPPPYLQSTGSATGSSRAGQRAVVAPVPFFDSILRAAPAFDIDDNDSEVGHDNDSASSSTLSLSEQLKRNAVSDWSSTLAPHLQQHASLHAYLDANPRLQEKLADLKDAIHTNLGKRTSLATRVARLQKKLHLVQLESDKRVKLLLSPKKKREFRRQVKEISSELEPIKELLHKYEGELARDQEIVINLGTEVEEYIKVSAQLDAIDDEVFGGPTQGHEDEDRLEQQYHILMETIKRLQSSISMEGRCQVHLNKSHLLCTTLIKELLVGLNIGIEIGVPTNQKHKTGLWRGSSPTHSANRSRSHILRAKTICGDLHTQYLLARAVQRRVAILPRLRVIDLFRLPGMTAKNVVDEQGLHRSLEQSYGEGKAVKAHIEGQQQLSRQRQAHLKKHIKQLRGEAREVWLELRKKRREVVEDYRKDHGEENQMPTADDAVSLPPYKKNLVSKSVIGLQQRDRDAIVLPVAFRRRVEKEGMARSKVIVRQVAIEVGGTIEEDKVEDHERTVGEEDIPGIELTFGY